MKDDPKVMACPKMIWDKRKEVLTYKRFRPESKDIS